MALRYGVLVSLVSMPCGLDFTDESGELPDQPESSPSVADVESPTFKSDVLERLSTHPTPYYRTWTLFPGAIVHTASSLCLTALPTTTPLGPCHDNATVGVLDGTELSMSLCKTCSEGPQCSEGPNDGFGQRWVHEPDAGTLVLAAHDKIVKGACGTERWYIEGNQCVDAPSGNLNAAQNLQVWQCNGMPQQQFGFDDEVYETYQSQTCPVLCHWSPSKNIHVCESTSKCMQGGGTIFASESSDASLCLDVWSDDVAPYYEKNLWLWDCLANENQLFKWLRPALEISSPLTGDEAGPSFVV